MIQMQEERVRGKHDSDLPIKSQLCDVFAVEA